MKLKDKVAIVTGGSSGIGLAIAQAFYQEGARVVIFGRDPKALSDTHRSVGEDVVTVRGDVRRLRDLDKLYETAAELGGVDVIVTSAGIQGSARFEEVDEEYFDRVIETNLKGTYFSIQKGIPLLREGGSIILISSVAAKLGIQAAGLYAASKAAVSMLAKSFAADLVERGVRVNSISPGFTLTPALRSLTQQDPQGLERRAEVVPMKRLAEPEEVARAALFLATPDASYITGANLDVDGGVSSILPGFVSVSE